MRRFAVVFSERPPWVSGLLIHAAVGKLGRDGRSADEPLGMALVGGLVYVRPGQDPQLVLRRKRTGARPARPAPGQAPPPGPVPPPANFKKKKKKKKKSRLGRIQQPSANVHSCSSPTCPAFSVLALKVIDSSMVSVSPDVDREGSSRAGTCHPLWRRPLAGRYAANGSTRSCSTLWLIDRGPWAAELPSDDGPPFDARSRSVSRRP